MKTTSKQAKSATEKLIGLLSDIDIDSVKLQHKAKSLWLKGE